MADVPTAVAAAEPDEPNPTPTADAAGGRHRAYDGRHRAEPGPEGLSVWATAQATGPVQRRGRYVPESVKHPARMLPAIAAHAVDAYTEAGDLVLDPMCGIGTTLVEAVHAGRDAIGVEYESRWSDIADANVAHAHTQGAAGRGAVIRGDATRLLSLVPAALAGQVALVVTSPPYGPTVHGLVRPGEDGIHKSDAAYNDGTDKGNLAYRDLTGLGDGFSEILRGCATLLRAGGTVVVTARPWRKHGQLVDLPSAVIAAGIRAGLVPTERCVALLAAVRDGHLVARPSFFQLQQIRKARTAGTPLHLIAHEDVLIFTKPQTPRVPTNPSVDAANAGVRWARHAVRTLGFGPTLDQRSVTRRRLGTAQGSRLPSIGPPGSDELSAAVSWRPGGAYVVALRSSANGRSLLSATPMRRRPSILIVTGNIHNRRGDLGATPPEPHRRPHGGLRRRGHA